MADLILEPVVKPDPNKLEVAYEVVADIETSSGPTVIKVPKFFQFDGASIPSAAWQIIGTPFNPRFMTASVFHDWIYHTHQVTKDDADELFYKRLLVDGVNKAKAWLMREAVETFGGGYWENDTSDLAYIKRLAKHIRADGRDPKDYGISDS